jgi:hypothetical protein
MNFICNLYIELYTKTLGVQSWREITSGVTRTKKKKTEQHCYRAVGMFVQQLNVQNKAEYIVGKCYKFDLTILV